MRAIAFAEKASAWDPIRIPWSWIAIVSSQPGVANQFERSELACAIAQIPAIDNPDPGPNNSEGNPFLSVYSRPGDNLIPREGAKKNTKINKKINKNNKKKIQQNKIYSAKLLAENDGKDLIEVYDIIAIT